MKDEQQIRLVERLQSGDPAAENELFEIYRKPIYWKVLRKIAADSREIEEVVSEVYLAIFEGLCKENFQTAKWVCLEAYIWGVTNNKIRDWFKKSKQDKEIVTPNPPDKEMDEPNPNVRLEMAELRKFLRECLKTLPPKFKQILDLRYFRELQVREIAAQLDIPAREVSNRLHYALKLMRKCTKKNRQYFLSLCYCL